MSGAGGEQSSSERVGRESAAVRLSGVTFAYPGSEFRLRISGWQLPCGAHAAVIGPSGSGKTTLLQLIAGILVPQAGSIQVGDFRVEQMADAARRRFRLMTIGFVFQDFQLLDYLSVLENIVLPYRLGHPALTLPEARDRGAELATAVGLADKLQRNVTRLSHGERQRVALCRALVGSPQLVLADEPTGNLDPRTKQQIMALLHEQVRLSGATLIMVTHDRQLLGGMDEVVDFDRWLADGE